MGSAKTGEKSGQPRQVVIATWIIAGLLALGFFYLCYAVYRTWNPRYTQDIARYQEMRERLVQIYPRAPDIPPLSIPPGSTVTVFYASAEAGLRAPPTLTLELTMPPEAAQAELERLLALSERFDSLIASTDEEGVVHVGDPNDYRMYMDAFFDPRTNAFGYQFGMHH